MSGRERKMQEVSEKYNNDSYRERHALSVILSGMLTKKAMQIRNMHAAGLSRRWEGF